MQRTYVEAIRMKGPVWWTRRRPGRGSLTLGVTVLACVPKEGAVPAPPSANLSECATPRGEWIWCDDFEQDRLAHYFEYDDAGGTFTRTAGAGRGGAVGRRAQLAAGQGPGGARHLARGKTQQAYWRRGDEGQAVYRDRHGRRYLRNRRGWVGGGGDKLTRAMSFASSTTWAQAMIAHVWSGSVRDQDYLVLDPASGTDTLGTVLTNSYNDFSHLRWLGVANSATPLFDDGHVGRWYCIEAHVRLNDAGAANGVFELWIDGA